METVCSAADDARFAAIVDHPLLAANGEITVGERPGLGLDLLADAVESFPAEPRGALR
jgi:L-alanine-DL-glutamate epimerase-like enolase superfamily enzyme